MFACIIITVLGVKLKKQNLPFTSTLNDNEQDEQLQLNKSSC